MDRRKFLAFLAAAGVAAGAKKLPPWPAMLSSAQAAAQGSVPRRQLGKTGEQVSMVGLGGFHLGRPPTDEDAVRLVRSAIDQGITFMDNSWDYNNGLSETRMGKALQDGYRQKVFLMTKADGRNKAAAARQLEESLRRLQTDTLDLWQFHEIIRTSDPERIFAKGGAIEAAIEARQAGKIRFIGFTGHKSPDIHLEMLRVAKRHQFHFDTVQMPLNVLDAHFDSFQKKVLPVAQEQGIGVLAMKPMGDKFILDSGAVTAVECLHYSMNLPVAVVITGIDSPAVLEQDLKAARDFQPLSAQEVSAILAQTATASRDGKYELYKTSDHFDSTAHNPQWLG